MSSQFTKNPISLKKPLLLGIRPEFYTVFQVNDCKLVLLVILIENPVEKYIVIL